MIFLIYQRLKKKSPIKKEEPKEEPEEPKFGGDGGT